MKPPFIGTVCLLLLGCIVSPARGQAAKVLQWQLEPDQQYRLVVDWSSQHVLADSTVTNSTKCDLIWAVKSVDAEGQFEISQTLANVRQSVQMNDGAMFQYDSTSDAETTGTTAYLANYWKPLLGGQREFKMSPQGKVTDSEAANSLAPTDNALVSRAFGRDGWRTAVRQGSVVFPPEGLVPNQTWTESQTVVLPTDGGRLAVTRAYTYLGQAKQEGSETLFEQIKVENQFEIESDEGKPFSIKVVQQNGTGEILFDALTGRLVKSKFDQTLKLRNRSKQREVESQLTISFELSFQTLPKVEATAGDNSPSANSP
ncbi:MAG: hypothetical protein P8N76_14345 [Pirellulaceae bacterium]|nr:hypothetical protein [Pirellulaceae bacterium]